MTTIAETIFKLSPKRDIIKARGVHPTETLVAPRDTLEIHLTKLWESVLDITPIGLQDNFFDLAGDSLCAARLCSQIEKTFGKTFLLGDLNRAQTVERVARVLRQRKTTRVLSSLVAIRSGGLRPPLYCIHPIGGSVHWYYDLARHLGTDQPVYGLQAQGLDGKQPVHTSIAEMAAHYVNEIRDRKSVV